MKESLTQNKPKKVLYVITKANWGGAQRYVFDLADEAQKAGHEVIVAYGDDGEMARRLQAAGIRTIQIPSLTRDVKVRSDGAVYRNLVDFFKKERPDVVHVNSAKAGGLGCLAARRTGVPRIIFTAHGWAFNENRPALQRCAIWILSGITVLLSHETLCASYAIADDIKKFPFTRKKLRVIHHGVDTPTFLSRSEAREKLSPRHTTQLWIGMVSELHPTKRVEDALMAMHELVKTHPETVLVVMGEGEERPRLEKLIQQLSLEKHVTLSGFVVDAPAYLHAFDLFLHTSRSEALGFAVLEAGAASLPVVATGVGGIPEIIVSGQNGLLVPPLTPMAATRALHSLIENPRHAKKLGGALLETVQSFFSKGRMIRETLSLY